LICSIKHKMTRLEMQAIFNSVEEEVNRAQELFEFWPVDLVHGVSVMAEESGEAVQAALRAVFNSRPEYELRLELIHTAAMCIRLMGAMDKLAGIKDLDTSPAEIRGDMGLKRIVRIGEHEYQEIG